MPNEDLGLPAMETLREQVIAWLTANEIDPNRIPTRPHMTLVGDQLTTDQRFLSAEGRVQLDPGRPDEIARETVTYTITVPPPPDVATWLLPRCSECGR